MTTSNDLDFVRNVIMNNGYLNGDEDNSLGDNPRCVKVVQYMNAWNSWTYGMVLEGEDEFRYERVTEFVRKPQVIWRYTP